MARSSYIHGAQWGAGSAVGGAAAGLAVGGVLLGSQAFVQARGRRPPKFERASQYVVRAMWVTCAIFTLIHFFIFTVCNSAQPASSQAPWFVMFAVLPLVWIPGIAIGAYFGWIKANHEKYARLVWLPLRHAGYDDLQIRDIINGVPGAATLPPELFKDRVYRQQMADPAWVYYVAPQPAPTPQPVAPPAPTIHPGWVGRVDCHTTVFGKVIHCAPTGAGRTWVIVATDDGYTVTWSSPHPLPTISIGMGVRLSGNVAAHDYYEGKPVTRLNYAEIEAD